MSREPEAPPLRYRKHVFVCMNERPADDPRGCCAAKGSPAIREYMKRRAKELGLSDIRINQAGCLDVCEAGPALVVYPEGVWYRCETKRDADEILLVHLRDDGRVPRLMLDRDEKSG
ncbi:MAG: (2Fe-2S) ferredoxin domain-containing protein [Alphaproteobacteria bacterium]|nr:(2Fe-2S) ferredoxin domain-containing protein [Alphaproteobacteria bacterium]